MIDVHPMLERFGADLGGVQLEHIDDDDFKLIYRAWLDYGVLRFRGQHMDEDGLQRFSVRFGPLEEIPLGRMGTSEDIAQAALFLADPDCFMTGERLSVTGGAELRRVPTIEEIMG